MCLEMVIKAIKNQNDIARLIHLRDVGINKLMDMTSSQITQAEKQIILEKIAERLVELGA